MARPLLQELREGDVVLVEAVVRYGWRPGAGPGGDESMLVRIGGAYGPQARVEPAQVYGLIRRHFSVGEQAIYGDKTVTIAAIDDGDAWCRQEDGQRFTIETILLRPIPPLPPEVLAAPDPEQPSC